MVIISLVLSHSPSSLALAPFSHIHRSNHIQMINECKLIGVLRIIYTTYSSNRANKKKIPLNFGRAISWWTSTRKTSWRHHDLCETFAIFTEKVENSKCFFSNGCEWFIHHVVRFSLYFCYRFPRNSRRHRQKWNIDWPLGFMTRRTPFNDFFFHRILFLEKKTENKFRWARQPTSLR